jgi:hypothetical protein
VHLTAPPTGTARRSARSSPPWDEPALFMQALANVALAIGARAIEKRDTLSRQFSRRRYG